MNTKDLACAFLDALNVGNVELNPDVLVVVLANPFPDSHLKRLVDFLKNHEDVWVGLKSAVLDSAFYQEIFDRIIHFSEFWEESKEKAFLYGVLENANIDDIEDWLKGQKNG